MTLVYAFEIRTCLYKIDGLDIVTDNNEILKGIIRNHISR
jgi:hypothetical protein